MKYYITIAAFFYFTINLKAQNLTLTPGNQGKLNLPKLTYEQIQAIPSPESGSIVYDVTTNCIRFFNGTKWLCTDQKTSDFAPNALNAWKVSELNPVNNFQSNHIAVDNQGNIYIAGMYNDNFRINGITYSALGYGDAFVVKYNSVGVAQWVKTGGNPNSYSYSSDIAVDNQGNVYLGGSFFNALNFDGVSVAANNSSGDVFLCKLSATDGSVLALKAIGGSNYDTLGELFVDNQSNVYMIGNFVGNCNFEGISINGTDNNDIFIAKCNVNLQFQWANKITGVSADDGRSIYGDNAGNVFITGYIASDATFAEGVKFIPGVQSFFIAKYNASNGNYIWHRNSIYTSTASSGNRVVCDNEGNAYLSGQFKGNMNLGGMQFCACNSTLDLLIAKINTNGDWQWYQQSKRDDYYGYAEIFDMKINAENEILLFCGASYNSTFGFANKRYTGNIFVFKFDKNGGVKGANIISSSGNAVMKSIAFNGNYHYITGYFGGSISFGNLSLSSPTYYNGFVAKFVE